MCTDVVSVSISVINKCTATYTMYITAGMNLLCHVHMIISILYIPIHTHATPTCTWCPLNICFCCCQSSLFSPEVQFSAEVGPAPEGETGKAQIILDVFLSSLLLIVTVIFYLLPHTAWYREAPPQLVHVHHILHYCGEVAVSECSVCEGNVKDTLTNALQRVPL